VIPVVVASILAQAEHRSESGLRYHLFGGGGGRAPMIIFLHGTHGNASYWGGFATAARAKGYIAVLPYSTGDGSDDGKSNDGVPRWGRVDVPKVASLARELQRTRGADPRRTHIAGFSNGAFYAFEIGLRHPEIFSSILCMGGGCGVRGFSDRAKSIGCYIVHGTQDTSVGFDAGRDSAERLRSAGFADVVFVEKTGKGHVIFFDEIEPYFAWLAKQKRVTVPGAGGALAWETELGAPGRRTAVYLYSPRDGENALVEWLENELFVDPGLRELAGSCRWVKLDRTGAVPEPLSGKRPGLFILETVDGKPKVVARFESVSSPKAVCDRLKSLR
jgi:predicted esterase